jgi:hypothetical protein
MYRALPKKNKKRNKGRVENKKSGIRRGNAALNKVRGMCWNLFQPSFVQETQKPKLCTSEFSMSFPKLLSFLDIDSKDIPGLTVIYAYCSSGRDPLCKRLGNKKKVKVRDGGSREAKISKNCSRQGNLDSTV